VTNVTATTLTTSNSKIYDQF